MYRLYVNHDCIFQNKSHNMMKIFMVPCYDIGINNCEIMDKPVTTLHSDNLYLLSNTNIRHHYTMINTIYCNMILYICHNTLFFIILSHCVL